MNNKIYFTSFIINELGRNLNVLTSQYPFIFHLDRTINRQIYIFLGFSTAKYSLILFRSMQ